MITFAGTVLVFTCIPVFLHFDLSMEKEVPNWIFLYATVIMLLYQATDALDGIHARNTQMFSPLGQLFDAAIDSILHGVMLISLFQALRVGGGLFSQTIFQTLVVSAAVVTRFR